MRRSLSLLLTLLFTVVSAVASTRPLSTQECSDDAEVVEQSFDPAPDENGAESGLFAPDTPFIVSWTLLNSGDCEWSRSYRLIFSEGERMDAPRTQRLRNAVEPGESVTLSLEMVAPSEADSYAATWRLRNEAGDTFGPDLTLEIAVDESQAASTSDVVLPEVLVFGGMGAGDDPYLIGLCVVEGELPAEPTMVLDLEGLPYRYADVVLCSFPEGSQVTVALTDPDGNSFSRSVVMDGPITGMDLDGNEYTGTVTELNVAWPAQAPAGEWLVTATATAANGEELAGNFPFEQIITVEPPLETIDDADWVELDNWPAAPIDPFAAAGGCHYIYAPGQELFVAGKNLPADTVVQLGFYHSRFGAGYLADQVTVETDGEGAFTIPYVALNDPGDYNIVTMQSVDPEGFHEDGTQYDFGLTDDEVGFTCLTVRLPANLAGELEIPLRLAFAVGETENSEIQVLDILTGEGFYPTYGGGTCNSSEPSWWPGGEWIVFQSNCVRDEESEFIEYIAADNYDLYAVLIDPTYTIPEEEKLLRLTNTPDVDETDPDVRLDGLIVYRETPAGEELGGIAPLFFYDSETGEKTATNINGRVPAWSPDGLQVAYMSDETGTWKVYAFGEPSGEGADEAGDEPIAEVWLVSRGCATHCRYPAWSPNGTQIIYHVANARDDLTPVALWIANADGSEAPRRYAEGEYARPAWSEDGGIIFQGPGGLYRGDTSSPPEIARYLYNSFNEGIFWAPDWSR